MSKIRNSISLILLPRKVLGVSVQASQRDVEQHHPTNAFRQKRSVCQHSSPGNTPGCDNAGLSSPVIKNS